MDVWIYWKTADREKDTKLVSASQKEEPKTVWNVMTKLQEQNSLLDWKNMDLIIIYFTPPACLHHMKAELFFNIWSNPFLFRWRQSSMHVKSIWGIIYAVKINQGMVWRPLYQCLETQTKAGNREKQKSGKIRAPGEIYYIPPSVIDIYNNSRIIIIWHHERTFWAHKSSTTTVIDRYTSRKSITFVKLSGGR